MPTSLFDGTVEEADLKLDRAGIKLFHRIRLKGADGSSKIIQKAVTVKAVGDLLVPGASGRFYLYEAFDMKGVHGVRLADGALAQGFPTNNLKVFMIATIVAVLWIAVALVAWGGVPIFGVLLLALGGAGWFYMNKGLQDAKAQFAGDAGD